MITQIAQHVTIDLTGGAGCSRLVLSLGDVDTLAQAELETQVAFAILAVDEIGDGSVALHRPGEQIPSDDEFEAVEAVSAADAIRDIRDFAGIA